MPNIHDQLDEAQRQCRALVEEMQAYKASRVLNEKATESLETTCAALQKTTDAIRPFTELRVRRLLVSLFFTTALNTLFFAIIVWLLLLRTFN